MPRIRFTQNIQRHVSCPNGEVEGATVAAALEAYFDGNPRARGYVLDDRGALREHMNVFVDGRQIVDRRALSDAISAAATIDVFQALSGG